MYLQSKDQQPMGVADDGVLGSSPRVFWGTEAPNGDASPWAEAAIGSQYIRSSAGVVALYIKTAANSADADWVVVPMSTALVSQTEMDVLDGVTATTAEINKATDVSARIVNATASTLTVTAATHSAKIVTLNRAAGIAVTLPAASGSGNIYKFVIGTTVSSNTTVIQVANASDSFAGFAYGVDTDAEGASGYTWNADANDDTLTMDGTAKGGVLGDYVDVIDVATNLFLVTAHITQSGGSEVTPFSAAVS